MPDWVVLIVYALAVARLTGLVVDDEITRPARAVLLANVHPDDRFANAAATLITCQWCSSIWIAAAATPLYWWFGHHLWLLLPAIGLAFSQVTGMTSRLGRM
jgi:hypothetical protein